MGSNIVILCMLLGLVLGIGLIVVMRKRIGEGSQVQVGAFTLGGAIVAAAPAILIKLGVIEQTAGTVLLAIIYFIVFIIGTTLVSSKAYRQEHNQTLK